MRDELRSALIALSATRYPDPPDEACCATLEGVFDDEPRARAEVLARCLAWAPAVSHGGAQERLVALALRLAERDGAHARAYEALAVPSCTHALASAFGACWGDLAWARAALAAVRERAAGREQRAALEAVLRARRGALDDALALAFAEGVSALEAARVLREVFAFAARPGPPAPRWLCEALAGDDAALRYEAAQGLAYGGWSDDARAGAALGAALGDGDARVVALAARELVARALRADANDALEALLSDARPRVRSAALAHLAESAARPTRALAACVRALGDESAAVREAAGRAGLACVGAPGLDRGPARAALRASRGARALDAWGAELLWLVAQGDDGDARQVLACVRGDPGPAAQRLVAALEARLEGAEDALDCARCAALGRSNGTTDAEVGAAAARLGVALPEGDASALVECAACGRAYAYERSAVFEGPGEYVTVSLERCPFARQLARAEGAERAALEGSLPRRRARWSAMLAHPRRWLRADAAWERCCLDERAGSYAAHAALLAHDDDAVRAEVLLRLAREHGPGERLDDALEAALERRMELATDPWERERAAQVFAASALHQHQGRVEALAARVEDERDGARLRGLLRAAAHGGEALAVALRGPLAARVLARDDDGALGGAEEREAHAEPAAALLAVYAGAGWLDEATRDALCEALDGDASPRALRALRVLAASRGRCDEAARRCAPYLRFERGRYEACALAGQQARAGAPVGALVPALGEALERGGAEDTAHRALLAAYGAGVEPASVVAALLRGARGSWSNEALRCVGDIARAGAALRSVAPALWAAAPLVGAYGRDVLGRALLRAALECVGAERAAALDALLACDDPWVCAAALDEASALRVEGSTVRARLEQLAAGPWPAVATSARRWLATGAPSA